MEDGRVLGEGIVEVAVLHCSLVELQPVVHRPPGLAVVDHVLPHPALAAAARPARARARPPAARARPAASQLKPIKRQLTS